MKCVNNWIITVVYCLMSLSVQARVVTDQLGREVVLPADVKRIVSMAPSVTELVFALGSGDRLVGATRYSDYPPEAEALPKIGSYVHLDLERILSLRPDVCIGTKDGNPKAVIDRLEALQVPVFAVNPVSFETVMASIHLVAVVLDVPDRGERLVQSMTDRIRAVDARVAAVSSRPGVFLQIGMAPIVSVGSPTYLNELIERAGGRNVAAGPTPYPRYATEQVLALRPDVILVSSMAKGTPGAAEAAAEDWRRWKGLPAAENNRVMIIDSDRVDRPGPRMVSGLETLMRMIHPELAGAAP
ncbi:MAG: cobalamin-binding protein [Deltaproteobacteria bacterium]|nr:MAG: cobalamin-binding protein [Deltaproteobacteria bacterium]